jgi:hypothetical protein
VASRTPPEEEEHVQTQKRFLSIKEAALEAGKSVGTLHRWDRLGLVPATTIAGRRVIPADAWARWLQQQADAAMGNLREAAGQ